MFDREKIEAIKRSRQRWAKDMLQPSLEALPESQDTFTTISGLEVKRLYTPEDIDHFDYEKDLGFPRPVPLHQRNSPHYVPGQGLDYAHVLRPGDR